MINELEKERIRNEIDLTLMPENETNVGDVYEDSINEQTAIFVRLAGVPHFLGTSFAAALFTAEQGDWINPSQHGQVYPEDIEWFERRAKLGPSWNAMETSSQLEERRTRIIFNTELTTPKLKFDYSSTTPDILMSIHSTRFRPCISHVEGNHEIIDIVRIKDWPGFWVLDESTQQFRQVRLNLTPHEFNIQCDLNNTYACTEANQTFELYAKVTCNNDFELIQIELFSDESSFLKIHVEDHGQLEIAELKLS